MDERGGCKDIAEGRDGSFMQGAIVNQSPSPRPVEIRAGCHDRKGESDRKRKAQAGTINIVFAEILRMCLAIRPVSK